MHAMCHSWGNLTDHIEYVVIGPDGRVKHSAEVPLPGMSMVHDMSITETYAIVYDLPVTVDLALAQSGTSFPFRWNPAYGARIGLMPLGGTAESIIWCDVGLCYVYHVLNAYDAPDGTVVIDVCRYDKMFDRDVYGPAGDCLPTLDRSTVDPRRRTVREERIDHRFHEFPRVRDNRTGRFHRFGYTAAVGERFAPGATYKHRPRCRNGRRARPRNGSRDCRARLRGQTGRHRRRRWLAAVLRQRPGGRAQRAGHPRCPRHHRAAGGASAAPGASTRRVPRQLDCRHRRNQEIESNDHG